MKRIFLIVLLGVFLIATGCTSVNTINDKEKKIENEISLTKIIKNSPVTPIIDNKYDFTYLEELPEDKVERYNFFLEDGNTNHLTDFTPEQIVLIYMNLVLENKVDKLYALTYDNGQLPSLDKFINEYDQYLSPYLNEDYLKYRFYDSIAVDKETRKKEELVVKIKIIYGITTQGVTYGLKKDNNVWKMDLYHLVEESKR